MEPLSGVPPGVRQIVMAVEASMEKLVSAAAEAIWAEVPAYAASPDDQLRNDVIAHIRSIFLPWWPGCAPGSPPGARTSRPAASRPPAGGGGDHAGGFPPGVPDRTTHAVAGRARRGRDDPVARDAALSIVAHIMQMIELGSTIAAEGVPSGPAAGPGRRRPVRRDLLEDLLRRAPAAGPKRGLLRAACLEPDTRLLAIAAALTGDLPEGMTVRTPRRASPGTGAGWRWCGTRRSPGSCRCRRAGRLPR